MAETIPAFDLRRWGPGGVTVVVVLLVSGFVAFLDGFLRQSILLEVLGTICLGGGITIFFIKVAEEIKPVTAKWSIVGEIGEVVDTVSKQKAGVVQIRSELWSAKSETTITAGARVRVHRTEGLLAWVAELEGQESSA